MTLARAAVMRRTWISRVRVAFHRHCYLLVVEKRRLFLRCAICGDESEGVAV